MREGGRKKMKEEGRGGHCTRHPVPGLLQLSRMGLTTVAGSEIVRKPSVTAQVYVAESSPLADTTRLRPATATAVHTLHKTPVSVNTNPNANRLGTRKCRSLTDNEKSELNQRVKQTCRRRSNRSRRRHGTGW